jgi:hypothetical protein
MQRHDTCLRWFACAASIALQRCIPACQSAVEIARKDHRAGTVGDAAPARRVPCIPSGGVRSDGAGRQPLVAEAVAVQGVAEQRPSRKEAILASAAVAAGCEESGGSRCLEAVQRSRTQNNPAPQRLCAARASLVPVQAGPGHGRHRDTRVGSLAVGQSTVGQSTGRPRECGTMVLFLMALFPVALFLVALFLVALFLVARMHPRRSSGVWLRSTRCRLQSSEAKPR